MANEHQRARRRAKREEGRRIRWSESMRQPQGTWHKWLRLGGQYDGQRFSHENVYNFRINHRSDTAVRGMGVVDRRSKNDTYQPYRARQVYSELLRTARTDGAELKKGGSHPAFLWFKAIAERHEARGEAVSEMWRKTPRGEGTE